MSPDLGLRGGVAALGERALVGMIHLAALPGTPRSRLSVDAIAEAAVADLPVTLQVLKSNHAAKRFYERLEGGPHELVIFDINRHAHTRSFFKSDFQKILDGLWNKPNQPYGLTVITNVGDSTQEVLACTREPGSDEIRLKYLGLRWPEGIYSLSHIALPFSPDDPLYGSARAPRPAHGMNLGTLEPRGETGMLHIPVNALMRLRYNPFFPYIEERLVEFTLP